MIQTFLIVIIGVVSLILFNVFVNKVNQATTRKFRRKHPVYDPYYGLPEIKE